MKPILMSAVIGAAFAGSAAIGAEPVQFHRFDLANGVRAVVVHVPGAPQQTTFTFLPVSLANDAAGRTQWSHLLEHMVIRSTDPLGLMTGEIVFNGETTHAYLRLETFAPVSAEKPENWAGALGRHAKWLDSKARQFDAETLEREKTNVALEEQGTAGNCFTTKFALAAWNQALVHGAAHVKAHGDVANATIDDVRAYADGRLPLGESVLIATIGPLEVKQARADLERAIGSLPARASKEKSKADAGEVGTDRAINATWDLPTRHVIWFWELPDRQPATQAAAACLARSVHVHLYTMVHNEWKDMVRTAQVYPCVEAGGAAYFLIDCCVADDADAQKLTAGITELLASFNTGKSRHGIIAMLAGGMANEVSTTVDFDMLRRQLPEQLRDSAEGVWLLGLLNYEYAWGVPVDQVGKELGALKPEALKAVLERVNDEARGMLTLRPQ